MREMVDCAVLQRSANHSCDSPRRFSSRRVRTAARDIAMRNNYALTLENARPDEPLYAQTPDGYAFAVGKSPKKKPLFSDRQVAILIMTIKKHRKEFKNQSDLAKALELTQPALSNLLAGKWKPGMSTALAVAELDGQDLEDLIGPIHGDAPSSTSLPSEESFHNVDVCVKFFGGRKTWSPWTIAAAKAGVYGDTDFPSPEWEPKLDKLEKALAALRRG